jgi:uncharacterized protein (TIGR02145 family)
MILTHGANSLARGGDAVIIDGISYRFKKFGSKLWTIESLKNPTSNSYQPNNTDKYGLLYPYSDFSNITNLLTDGWHIPTKSDFDDLITICGSVGSDYISEDFGGDNTNGFNACLLGYVNQDSQFIKYNERGYLWSNTDYNPSNKYNVYFYPDLFSVDDNSNKSNTKLQIRLVKDAP